MAKVDRRHSEAGTGPRSGPAARPDGRLAPDVEESGAQSLLEKADDPDEARLSLEDPATLEIPATSTPSVVPARPRVSVVIPALNDRELAKVAARLAVDEAMHFSVLTQALGRPLPGGALSFGA